MTSVVASIDVAPDGKIYVLEPHGMHQIDEQASKVTSQVLEDYGYHRIATSSQYIVISQEFYR